MEKKQATQPKGGVKRKAQLITLLEIERQLPYTLQQLLKNGFNLHKLIWFWLPGADQ